MSTPAEVDANTLFDATVADYYRAWFRFHPEAAVDAGVPGYAHLLTPVGEAAHAATASLNNALLVSLNAIDPARLDPERRLDFDVLYGAASVENQALVEVEPYHVDPARGLPVHALFQLTMREVDDFPGAARARLQAVPAQIAALRAYVQDKAARVPPLWLQSAITAATRGAEYFHTLPAHPKFQGRDDWAAPIREAAQALADYVRFLQTELGEPQGTVGCGREHFDSLLRVRHFLDTDADNLYRLGEQLFEETERDLKDAARALGADDVAQAAKQIQRQHPRADELLAVYTQHMRAAHDFVAARDLVSIPAPQRLDIIDTPVFLRHQIPFAAYYDPAPNDPRQQGYYYVTPPQSDAELAEHDRFGLMHTCVHEAWPGHHLQFVTANRNTAARSLPRLLNASATMYEGWALYCEQLMHEQGFLNAPEQRFILLKDRLWRALRILIDVDLHVHALAPEDAAARLSAVLGFPPAQARAEINWYSKAPTVPMGYATGWALINAARDRLRTRSPAPSLKEFHDRLLGVGSIALPLVMQRAFGADLWRTVHGMVFRA